VQAGRKGFEDAFHKTLSDLPKRQSIIWNLLYDNFYLKKVKAFLLLHSHDVASLPLLSEAVHTLICESLAILSLLIQTDYPNIQIDTHMGVA